MIFDKNVFEKCVFPGGFRPHTGPGWAHTGPKNFKRYMVFLFLRYVVGAQSGLGPGPGWGPYGPIGPLWAHMDPILLKNH